MTFKLYQDSATMDSSGRNLTHQWSHDERLSLCLMKTFFAVDAESTAKIFNNLYRDRLRKEGYTAGLRASTLSTMFHELRFRRSQNEPWKTIGALSLARLRHSFWKEKNQIEDSAFDSGVELVLRKKEDHRTKVPLLQRLRNAQRRETMREDTPSSAYSADSSSSEETLCRPRKQTVVRQAPKSARAPGKSKVRLFSTIRGDGTPGLKHPVLLFRAFETAHQYRSRMHKRASSSAPPAYDSSEFQDLVRRHLMIDKNFQSPFISLTQNPKAAIKYLDNRENCSLAVFEFNALQTDGIERFDDDSIPYLVPTICDVHEIDDLPRSYTGRGEWLCWASIHAEPIATWTLAEVKAIEECMKAMKSVSYDSGVALGKYLIGVSVQWQATIAYKLLWSFKIDGHLKGTETKTFDDFVRGLHFGSQQGASPLSPTEMNIGDDLKDLNKPQPQVLLESDADTDEILQHYSTTPARNRRRVVDSDDEPITEEDPTYFTDSPQEVEQIAPVNVEAFRQRVLQFAAAEKPPSSASKRYSARFNPVPQSRDRTVNHLKCSGEVVDLTEDKNDTLDDEVVFQSARRATVHSRSLSILSRSSTVTNE